MIKYEYEVYTASRDTQIYAGDIHNPDEVNDDTRWRDWDGDILLDVVMAENEKEAVKMIASQYGLHESTLYAVQHTASAVLPDGKTRIEAISFTDGERAGIAVCVPGKDTEIYVVADDEKLSAYSKPRENLYQVLSWNDEYLSMAIASSPVPLETARRIMRSAVTARMVDLDIAKDKDDAEKIYDDAPAFKLDDDNIQVFPYTAAIRYGGEFEERYEIVLCHRAVQ